MPLFGTEVRHQGGRLIGADLLHDSGVTVRLVDRASYPQPDSVAVVSGDTQQWEFVSAEAVHRHGGLPLLDGHGEMRWLSEEEAKELRYELLALASCSDIAADERLHIGRATALVDHGLATGTGIAVVPPA